MHNRLHELEEQLASASGDTERFGLLCTLTEALIPVDISRAISLAEEAISIARRCNDPAMEAESLDLLGECYARSGRYEQGIAVLKEAVPKLERVGNHRRAMVVNTNLGNTYWMAGEYAEALTRFRTSHSRAIELGDRRHLRMVKNNIGNLFLHRQRYSEATAYLEEGLALSREDGDELNTAQCLHNLGRARLECSDYAEGLKNLRESLALFTQTDYKPGIAAVQIDIGRCYRILGDYERSLEAYMQSVTISAEIGDGRNEAMALINIGDLYQQTGNPEAAGEHFRLSLQIKEKLGNPREVAGTLLNLGAVLLEQNRSGEAAPLFRRALSIARDIDDPRPAAYAAIRLARLAARRKSTDETERFLSEARSSVAKVEGVIDQALLYAEIGEMEIEHGDPEEGLAILCKGLEAAERIDAERIQGTIHGLLAALHERKNDLENAFIHLRRQQSIERKIFTEDSDHRLKSLMMIYEVDRARAELALAEKETEILRLQNRQLEQTAEHHRKELITGTMFLSQKNDFLRKMLHRLAPLITSSSGEIKEELKMVSTEIEGVIDARKSWNLFEEQFRRLQGNYLNILAARYPKLTPTELKVCALIRIGLSTKEIARILTTEPRSIDKYRQRIRGKIGLDSPVNLQSFLQGIQATE